MKTGTVKDVLPRFATSQVLRRLRNGRIEVEEDGRQRGFGPPDAELRATVNG